MATKWKLVFFTATANALLLHLDLALPLARAEIESSTVELSQGAATVTWRPGDLFD